MRKHFSVMIAVLLSAGSPAWAAVGGGDITFWPKGAGKVLYSHEAHVMKAGLKCSDCHYKIFNTHEVRRNQSMDTIREGASCGTCHNGSRAFAPQGNCSKCHR